MTRFVYIEQMLISNGYARHCGELPLRDAGHSPDCWMLHVRDVASVGIQRNKWNLTFAQDLIYCAELICVELRRFPVMVGWDYALYEAAAESSTHPLDRNGMLLLKHPAVFDDEKPLDAETIAMLNDLISDGDEGART